MKFFDEKLADKGITKEDIDELTIGSAMGVGENWAYGGRNAAFLANFPFRTSAMFVDKQCGSAGAGMHVGIMEIMTGFSKCVLSTGVEHMTRVSMQNTHITPNLKMIDKKSEWFRPKYDFMVTSNMIQTAQKLYEEEEISYQIEF